MPHLRTMVLAGGLLSLVVATSAAAQQLAYVSAPIPGSSCSPQVTGCTLAQILVVNTVTQQVQGAVRLAASPQQVRKLLVHPDGRRLYVVIDGCGVAAPGGPHVGCPGFSVVTVFDTRTLTQVGSFTVNGPTSDCALSPQGERFICGQGLEVTVVDTASGEVVARVPAEFPTSVVMTPDGRRLYVAQADNRITVHRGDTYATLDTIQLAGQASALAMPPDGSRLYAAVGRSVVEIDTTTERFVGVIEDVAPGSTVVQDIAIARGHAYVSTRGAGVDESVIVIDLAHRTIVRSILAASAGELAASNDETRMFLLRGSALEQIDTASNQVVASTSLPGGGPGRLAVSPPAPGPRMFIDAPLNGATLAQPFSLRGWAVDVFGASGGPGIDVVHVWAYPANGSAPKFVGAAIYYEPRPDVGALLGSTYMYSGYFMPVFGLVPGPYTFTVFARSRRTGTFTIARQVAITVAPSVRIVIDTPARSATVGTTFDLAGWAIDGGAATDAGIAAVHLWAYPASGAAPVFAGAATLGLARSDVAVAFGPQFHSAGYSATVHLTPGSFTLVAFALQSATGTFSAQSAVPITVTAPQPFIFIDIPAPGSVSPTNVRVAGWAIEVGAVTGTGVDAVHVWAYPAAGGTPLFMGAAAYGGARPDIAALFGARYASAGFDVTAALPPGAYNVVAFAHSTTTNSFTGVRLVPVTVR